MPLEISSALKEAIGKHGEKAYPNECCGALLGHVEDSGVKVAQELLPLDNRREGEEARRRFLVTADDYLFADREAAQKGMEILGFYHSHPDHPARPSEYDREHALPWYACLIVSVEQGHAGALTHWVLSEDRSSFLRETLDVKFHEPRRKIPFSPAASPEPAPSKVEGRSRRASAAGAHRRKPVG